MTLYDLNGKTIYAGSRPIEKVYLGSNLLVHNKPSTYLAQDSDFSGTSNGGFKYIGEHLYVEIPHVIKGVNVRSYKDMFRDTSVKGVVSTNIYITDMSGMFRNSQATSLDLSSFNTSRVTTMSEMFQDSQVTSLDLRSFSTNRVTNMGSMFRSSQATTLDLSSFDTSNVTNMSYMFQFSQATILDLSSFNTRYVRSKLYVFSRAKARIGYARTQTDADKLNSYDVPSQLRFVVHPDLR